jgi:hypothetical protein
MSQDRGTDRFHLKMARTTHIHTPEQNVFWVDVVRALEAGEFTFAELMAKLDISRATLYRNLALGRKWRDEEEADADTGGPEIDDAPILHLTYDPSRERREWIDLGSSGVRTSLDDVGGSVLVGNHNGTRLKRQRLGTGRQSSEARNDKLPPADGLKGGTG